MRAAMVVSILVVLTASQVALADVPKTISYQGILRQDDGNLVPDGDYELTFRLYDLETGGAPLWTETDSVTVERGIFNVILGKETALDLDFDVTYWLSVEVEGGGELEPRVELTSSSYAFRAAVADSVVGGAGGADNDWIIVGDDMYSGLSGNVGIGTTTPDEKLEVIGRIRGRFSEAENTTLDITPGTDGAGIDVLNASTAWGLNIKTDGTSRVLVRRDGNVGIGTTSPDYKLDVAGDIRATGTIYGNIGGTVDNADKVDGYHAGNSSGQVAVSNGTVCTNLNADKVDGYHAGNSSGQVGVSNGTKCSNLNADMVDGTHVLVKDIFTGGGNDYFVNTSWVKIYGYGTSYRLKIENPSGSGTSIRYVYSLDFGSPSMNVLSAGQNVTFSYSGYSSIEIRVMRHNIIADYQVTLHGVNGYNGWVHAHVIYND